MKSYVIFSFSLGKDDADQKLLMQQQLVARGNGRPPDAPRDVQAQPGSRGCLLTWKLPAANTEWIRGWRVYRDVETNLAAEVSDPGRKQLYVELSSGETPPLTNLFVSAVSAAGAESPKVLVRAQALPESGAPTIPSLPPGYAQEAAGGAARNYYGRKS